MLIDSTPIARTTGQAHGATRGSSSSIRSIAAQGDGGGKPECRGLRALLTGGLLLPLLALLVACARPADEAALRDTLAGMQAAVEARDADRLLGAVAEDFAGPEGMDREGLRRYVTLLLLRRQRVGVVLGPVAVDIHGERAAARFDALVTGADGLLPRNAEVLRVETVWRREGGEWRLVAADWSQPAGGH